MGDPASPGRARSNGRRSAAGAPAHCGLQAKPLALHEVGHKHSSRRHDQRARGGRFAGSARPHSAQRPRWQGGAHAWGHVFQGPSVGRQGSRRGSGRQAREGLSQSNGLAQLRLGRAASRPRHGSTGRHRDLGRDGQPTAPACAETRQGRREDPRRCSESRGLA